MEHPNMNILIVEDNEEMRRMVKSLLADLASEVFECGDGATALILYVQHRPDLVLMDLELPEVDGINATRQLKSAFPEARIMIVTNHNDDLLREAAREAGACDYILKENLLDLRRVLAAGTLG
jgi:CheY-like chemotaxis protein